jgi:hypothetical protein
MLVIILHMLKTKRDVEQEPVLESDFDESSSSDSEVVF